MAKVNRKDSKGRVLEKGESERRTGGYDFRYIDRFGKRISVYAKDLKKLRRKEREIRKNDLNGNHKTSQNKTINDVYLRWKTLKKGLRNNTFQNYQYMYETYVMNAFGNRTIKDLVRSDVKEFYINLADTHLKANTIDCIHTVLHQVLEMALDDDLIRYNPSDKALTEVKKNPEYKNEKKKALTITEEKTFLNYLDKNEIHKRWATIFITMLRTGLRVSELCGLQDDDIDFENNLIYVKHNLIYFDKGQLNGKCGYEMHSAKTKAGIRIIPMLPEVRDAIYQEKEYQKLLDINNKSCIDGYDKFVFLNRFGDPLNQGVVNKALRSIIKKCNEELISEGRNDLLLPKFSSHIFRHTFATRSNEANINDKVRMSSLGHSDITITNEIYTDASVELMSSEFEKLERYLSENALTPHTPNYTPDFQ